MGCIVGSRPFPSGSTLLCTRIRQQWSNCDDHKPTGSQFCSPWPSFVWGGTQTGWSWKGRENGSQWGLSFCISVSSGQEAPCASAGSCCRCRQWCTQSRPASAGWSPRISYSEHHRLGRFWTEPCQICEGVHLRSDRQRCRANKLQPVPFHAHRLGEEAVHVVDGEVQRLGVQLVFPNNFHHPVDKDGPHVTCDLRMVLQEARPWPEPRLGWEMCSGPQSVQEGVHTRQRFSYFALSHMLMNVRCILGYRQHFLWWQGFIRQHWIIWARTCKSKSQLKHMKQAWAGECTGQTWTAGPDFRSSRCLASRLSRAMDSASGWSEPRKRCPDDVRTTLRASSTYTSKLELEEPLRGFSWDLSEAKLCLEDWLACRRTREKTWQAKLRGRDMRKQRSSRSRSGVTHLVPWLELVLRQHSQHPAPFASLDCWNI